MENGILFVDQKKVGGPPNHLFIPSKERNLMRIEDDNVRQLCEACLKELERKGVEIRPIQNYWFSLWYKGKRFMYLECRKKFFVCEIQRADGGWSDRIKVVTKENWDKMFNDEIIPVLEKIESGYQSEH